MTSGQRVVPPEIPPGSVLVSMSESKSRQLDVVTGKARLTRAWAELIHRAHELGWKGSLKGSVSGLRTYSEQRELYLAFLRGEGAPAFHPSGPSRHMIKNVRRNGQWYAAVDVTRPEELIRIARRAGVDLVQPYADEPWHIEALTPFILYRPGRQPGPATTESAPAVMPILAVVIALLFLAIGLALRERYGCKDLPLVSLPALLVLCFATLLLAPPALALLPLALGAMLVSLTWPAKRHKPDKWPPDLWEKDLFD